VDERGIEMAIGAFLRLERQQAVMILRRVYAQRAQDQAASP
jgi:hypothetical protein